MPMVQGLLPGGGGSGDITDVVAGQGLTGGAASGSATIDVGAGWGISVSADAVALDNTIDVSASPGTMAWTASADATDIMTMSRTFAGGGLALGISMGASTTGDALDIDMVAGATGRPLRIHQGAANYFQVGATGAFTVTPASGQGVAFTTVGAGGFTVSTPAGSISLTAAGSALVVVDSAGSVVVRKAADVAPSTPKVIQFDDVGASPVTAGFAKHCHFIGRFQPGSGTASWAGVHINSIINGTSTGKASHFAVVGRTNTLTGGTVNLVDFGTSPTDYGDASYASLWRLDSSGLVHDPVGVAKGHASLQTTDGTVTTAVTVATGSDTVRALAAYVVGKKSDGTQGAVYRVEAMARNDSGTLTVTNVTTVIAEDDAAWTADWAASGTNAILRVTGNAGDTVDWDIRYESVASL